MNRARLLPDVERLGLEIPNQVGNDTFYGGVGDRVGAASGLEFGFHAFRDADDSYSFFDEGAALGGGA